MSAEPAAITSPSLGAVIWIVGDEADTSSVDTSDVSDGVAVASVAASTPMPASLPEHAAAATDAEARTNHDRVQPMTGSIPTASREAVAM
ncbi:MAG: hypothetical protein U1F43_06025 [Myxococcota bacterium]